MKLKLYMVLFWTLSIIGLTIGLMTLGLHHGTRIRDLERKYNLIGDKTVSHDHYIAHLPYKEEREKYRQEVDDMIWRGGRGE